MRINTTKFGEIEVSEDTIFTFVEPVIGYEHLKKYVLVEHNVNSLFKWLQSLEDPDLAFPVTSPAFFDIEYQFEIPTEVAEKLSLTSVDTLLSVNIVSIPNANPRKSTINLLAPIIINAANKQGMQFILSNSNYEVRYPLFKDEQTPVNS